MEPILDENIEDNEQKRIEKILLVIKVCERISSISMFVGYVFRLQHWPFSFLIILLSFSVFFILQIIKIFFVEDKLTSSVKAGGMAIAAVGLYCWYRSIQNANIIVIIGLLLYFSFDFIKPKLNKP